MGCVKQGLSRGRQPAHRTFRKNGFEMTRRCRYCHSSTLAQTRAFVISTRGRRGIETPNLKTAIRGEIPAQGKIVKGHHATLSCVRRARVFHSLVAILAPRRDLSPVALAFGAKRVRDDRRIVSRRIRLSSSVHTQPGNHCVYIDEVHIYVSCLDAHHLIWEISVAVEREPRITETSDETAPV